MVPLTGFEPAPPTVAGARAAPVLPQCLWVPPKSAVRGSSTGGSRGCSTAKSFEDWRPRIEGNLDRLSEQVTGQPHERNLEKSRDLVHRGDLPELHRVLTGLDRDSIEMREVPPCPACSLTSSVASSST